MKKNEILDFVKTNNLAVIATADTNGKPEAAVVEFGELKDLTIIIDLLDTSRKYKNLKDNKNVAVVIGWDNEITVQMDTLASELSGDELKIAKNAYFAKNPRAKKWEDKPGIVYFALKPVWAHYSNVGKSPWVIEEFTW